MNTKKTPGDKIGNLMLDFQSVDGTFKEIGYGQTHFIIDDFSARIHTTVTNLPKRFRRYLQGPSKSRLVELDIACSQPLFAAVAAKAAGYDCPSYLSACESGEIYEIIKKSHRMRKTASAKKNIMYHLFRDPSYPESRIEPYLQKHYPQFYQFVADFKGNRHDGGVKLAMEMQKAELSLVVDGLCKRILEERPETFILTIHDSLLVEPQDTLWVETCFMDEFQKLGVTPTIRQRLAGDDLPAVSPSTTGSV